MSAKIGAKIKMPRNNLDKYNYLFGEDQSRYLLEIREENKDKAINILKENSIYYEIIGKTQPSNFELENEFNVKIEELNDLNTNWFRKYFDE